MIYLLLALFILLALAVYKLDKSLYGTAVTPTTILILPFIGISLSSLLIGGVLGFVKISPLAIAVWMLWSFIFWASGYFLSIGALKKRISKGNYVLDNPLKIEKVCFVVAFLCITIVLFGLIKAMNSHGGFSALKSEEFTEEFAGRGFTAHALNVLKFLLVYFLYSYKKGKIKVVFIFTILAFLFIYQVKAWILLPFLATIILKSIMGQLNFNLKKAVLYLVAIFGGFFLVYFISLGSSMPFSFVFNHFSGYLFSGILGFSEHLRNNLPVAIDSTVLIKPVTNALNVLLQKDVSTTVSDMWVNINSSLNKGSNVKTLFGSILVFGGFFKGTVYVISLSVFFHLFHIFSTVTKSILIYIVYSYFLSGLFLGWFDIYFNLLFFWELPFICFALIIASKIKFNFTSKNESIALK
jgi:hypothetical protein